jgi:hypothetical protein
MSKTNFYHQCSLQNGNVHTLTHLPEEFAQVGRKIRLKDEDGNWERGWEVRSVGEPIAAEYAEAKAHAYQDIWKPSTALTTRGKK